MKVSTLVGPEKKKKKSILNFLNYCWLACNNEAVETLGEHLIRLSSAPKATTSHKFLTSWKSNMYSLLAEAEKLQNQHRARKECGTLAPKPSKYAT